MSKAHVSWFTVTLLAASLAACSDHPLPTQPTAMALPPATALTIPLEAEAGSGDGQTRERSRASGGRTVHLGPGERRLWTFALKAAPTAYAVSVTYSNGREGENEVIRVTVDGAVVGTFRNRDSGDAIEGWNLFVTDAAGMSTLDPTSHTVTLEVQGGDGCVEIDRVTLSPVGAVS